MFEKVNPEHPDKVADRIAGAIVDFAYTQKENPIIAVEVLIGHGECNIIAETNIELDSLEVQDIVHRIAGHDVNMRLKVVKQDEHLAANQNGKLRCGDNGIFKGCPITKEQKMLSDIAHKLYDRYQSDGKYILDINPFGEQTLIICQSNANGEEIAQQFIGNVIVNPLGDWTGGTNVDTGATNRKLGSDMGDAVTGGGLHGKDLSKADVSVNIWCHLMAEFTGKEVEAHCAIGDETVNGIPFETIVQKARDYVNSIGGFEKLAEWGLI